MKWFLSIHDYAIDSSDWGYFFRFHTNEFIMQGSRFDTASRGAYCNMHDVPLSCYCPRLRSRQIIQSSGWINEFHTAWNMNTVLAGLLCWNDDFMRASVETDVSFQGRIILFFKRIQFCSLVYLGFPISTDLLTYFGHISIHWSICRCFYNLEFFGLPKYWGAIAPLPPLFLRPCISRNSNSLTWAFQTTRIIYTAYIRLYL